MIEITKQITLDNNKRVKAGSIIDFEYKVSENDKAIAYKLKHFRALEEIGENKNLLRDNKLFNRRVSVDLSEEWDELEKPITEIVAQEKLFIFLESIIGKGNLNYVE